MLSRLFRDPRQIVSISRSAPLGQHYVEQPLWKQPKLVTIALPIYLLGMVWLGTHMTPPYGHRECRDFGLGHMCQKQPKPCDYPQRTGPNWATAPHKH